MIAAPMRRTRYGRAVPRGFDGDTLQECRARFEWLALQARPGADTAVERARLEVLIALFEPHLPCEVVPVQHRRDARVRVEFVAFAAVIIREEHRVAWIDDQLLA